MTIFLMWLDGAGNLVDEEHLVELLDIEPDYERGLEKLDVRIRASCKIKSP